MQSAAQQSNTDRLGPGGHHRRRHTAGAVWLGPALGNIELLQFLEVLARARGDRQRLDALVVDRGDADVTEIGIRTSEAGEGEGLRGANLIGDGERQSASVAGAAEN